MTTLLHVIVYASAVAVAIVAARVIKEYYEETKHYWSAGEEN